MVWQYPQKIIVRTVNHQVLQIFRWGNSQEAPNSHTISQTMFQGFQAPNPKWLPRECQHQYTCQCTHILLVILRSAAGLMLARNRQNSIQDCKRPPARINRKINVYEWMYIVYIYICICMHACMHVCMYVSMYQCILYVSNCVHIISIYICTHTLTHT